MTIEFHTTHADTEQIGAMINQLKSLALLHEWQVRKWLPKPLNKYQAVVFLIRKKEQLVCINVDWRTGRLQLLTGLPESEAAFRKWTNKRWPAILRHTGRIIIGDARYHVPSQSRFY